MPEEYNIPEHLVFHHEGENSAGEHRWGDFGQLILAIIFIVVWILDSFFLKLTVIGVSIIPWFIRLPIALLIFYYGYRIAQKSMQIMFNTHRENPEMIDYDLYALTRHPMYTGALLLLFAFLTFSFSISAFFVFLLTTGFYLFLCRFEEKLLINMFGDQYRQYMKTVPMVIPKPGTHKKQNPKQ